MKIVINFIIVIIINENNNNNNWIKVLIVSSSTIFIGHFNFLNNFFVWAQYLQCNKYENSQTFKNKKVIKEKWIIIL